MHIVNNLRSIDLLNQKIFSVGSENQSRITIATQQMRAFQLAEGLLANGRVKPDSKIAIIGAGFAGLSMAAALSKQCGNIHLFEANEDLLPLQRGNTSRYVHPYLYDWPDDGSMEDETCFPMLNWQADFAGAVSERVLSEWRRYEPAINMHFGTKVIAVRDTSAVELDFSHGKTEHFELAIFCIGFGWEPSDAAGYCRSYWRDDDLHQMDPFAINRFRVVGNGDGGLVDALRICIRDFDHKRSFNRLISDSQFTRLGQQAKQLDAEASASPDAGAYLERAYAQIELPDRLLDGLGHLRRSPQPVVLQARSAHMWRLDTSLLNRILALALRRLNILEYVSGSFEPQAAPSNERVVLRTGPKSAVAQVEGLRECAINWGRADLLKCTSPAERSALLPNVSLARRPHEKTSAKIFVVCNQEHAHTARAVDKFCADARRRLKEWSIDPQITTFLIDPELGADDPNVARLQSGIESQSPGFLVIMSSDLAELAVGFAQADPTIVLVGAHHMIETVHDRVGHLSAKPPFAVSQVIDLAAMVENIELFFPGVSLCYLADGQHPVDEMYYQKLAELADTLACRNLVTFRLSRLDISDGPDWRSIRAKADLFTGRYGVHKHGLSNVFAKIPYISGYYADVQRGAIASIDTDDEKTAQLLVERIILPLVTGGRPLEDIFRISRPKITVNRPAAEAFGFSFGAKAQTRIDEFFG